MKIYTKTGDNGETGLFGGKRVGKDHLRIDAYGTVDELNAFCGLAITEIKNPEIINDLTAIQNRLFVVGSDLATPEENKSKISIPRTEEKFFIELENRIDYYSTKLEDLRNFILPGGSKGAALLHICRTVCRRAERLVVALEKKEQLNHLIVVYLNRLSDFFFVLSRYENALNGVEDVKWEKE